MLGVRPDATTEQVRAAYRELARRQHPDLAGSAVATGRQQDSSMAAINEAYRVLRDPTRRADYDRTRFAAGDPVGAGPSATVEYPGDDAMVEEPQRVARPTVLAPAGPARFPWRLAASAAVLGSSVVMVSSLFDSPPSSEPPDGLLRPGSCVQFEVNSDAREVACLNDGTDLVVDVMVPLDAKCPAGTLPHRDRLGLGVACLPS